VPGTTRLGVRAKYQRGHPRKTGERMMNSSK
jgi:hypothetical protein